MHRALALQAERAQATGRPDIDVTLDCEDGAPVGGELEHAALIARLLCSQANRFKRVGVRVQASDHPLQTAVIDYLVEHAGRQLAYVTFPKIRDLVDAQRCIARLREACLRHAIDRSIPVHVLIETHAAVFEIESIAALAEVECLSFGLMDFVSAHGEAIPDSAMQSPGQFDHGLVRRAKLAITAASHAHGKVPSHNVTVDAKTPRSRFRRCAPRYAGAGLYPHVEHSPRANRPDRACDEPQHANPRGIGSVARRGAGRRLGAHFGRWPPA